MPLGSTVKYARWRILVVAICRLPTLASTIVNTATTTVATADTMAAQSAACSNKTSVCKLDMGDWFTEEPEGVVGRVSDARRRARLIALQPAPPAGTHWVIEAAAACCIALGKHP